MKNTTVADLKELIVLKNERIEDLKVKREYLFGMYLDSKRELEQVYEALNGSCELLSRCNVDGNMETIAEFKAYFLLKAKAEREKETQDAKM